MTLFYDSTRPELIPNRDYAILYRDGLYGSAGIASAHLFKHVRWITITGDYHNCGIIDYEPGEPDYVFGALARYIKGRISMQKRGRIYCDRSDTAGAVQELGNLTSHPLVKWHIATLDDIDWTAGQLAEDILHQFGAKIDPNSIWANQNHHDPEDRFDRSKLFRAW